MATTDEPRRAPAPEPTSPRRGPLHAALARNLAAVEARIASAARAAGRGTLPRVVAVTKTVGADVARALVELGSADLGENRLQVLDPKWRALVDEPPRDDRGAVLATRWHFIGHLQRNKAGAVAERADAVHSVDSLRLLEALDAAARQAGRTLDVYLQVKLWPEADKGGFEPGELEAAVDALFRSTGLAPAGFMTMAPLLEGSAAEAAAREVFEGLVGEAGRHADRPWRHGRALLSMGMSDDLEQAVAAGSDWLRIGRALFTDLPQDGGPGHGTNDDATRGSRTHD